jgi:predicted dehydrogenase
MVDVTSPDNVVVSGRLVNGAVASLHVAAIPWAGSGYRMEIYGRKGTLVATGEDSPQLCEVTLYGAQEGNTLSELAVPPRLVYVPAEMPKVSPYNIGQLYSEFAHAIRTGQSRHPTFDTAVDLHHFIDALRQSSDSGREVILG